MHCPHEPSSRAQVPGDTEYEKFTNAFPQDSDRLQEKIAEARSGMAGRPSGSSSKEQETHQTRLVSLQPWTSMPNHLERGAGDLFVNLFAGYEQVV